MILLNRIKMLLKIYSVHIFQIFHQKDLSLLPYKSRCQKFLLVNSFHQECIFFIRDSGIFCCEILLIPSPKMSSLIPLFISNNL